MNHNKKAREIAIAVLRIAHKHLSERYRTQEERGMDYEVCIAAKLKELEGEAPKDLDILAESIVDVIDRGISREARVLCTIDKLREFSFVPEVPADLEAAVRDCFHATDLSDLKHGWGSLPNRIVSAVAPLLADKDRILELQHKTISRLKERVKELQKIIIIDGFTNLFPAAHAVESSESPDED